MFLPYVLRIPPDRGAERTTAADGHRTLAGPSALRMDEFAQPSQEVEVGIWRRKQI